MAQTQEMQNRWRESRYRAEATLSLEEFARLKELADANGLTQSKTIAALIMGKIQG